MIGKLQLTQVITGLFMLFISTFSFAQKTNFHTEINTSEIIKPAPESVFEMFRKAGMKPVDHKLTQAQKEKIIHAFALLPPLHQRILKKHLLSVSFMDNMPNSALTSLIDTVDGEKRFNITFRAGLLDETISQWATWKENSCFKPTGNADYKVRVEAGDMDALIYVLLHEATHVVDVVTEITPHFVEQDSTVRTTPFTKGVWHTANLPEKTYIDSLLEQTRFRSGKQVDISLAPEVYRKLSNTPFPSLYGMAAWSEDLAEFVSIHHMTTQLRQPFYVVVTKDNVELFRFEPMKNALVRRRLTGFRAFCCG